MMAFPEPQHKKCFEDETRHISESHSSPQIMPAKDIPQGFSDPQYLTDQQIDSQDKAMGGIAEPQESVYSQLRTDAPIQPAHTLLSPLLGESCRTEVMEESIQTQNGGVPQHSIAPIEVTPTSPSSEKKSASQRQASIQMSTPASSGKVQEIEDLSGSKNSDMRYPDLFATQEHAEPAHIRPNNANPGPSSRHVAKVKMEEDDHSYMPIVKKESDNDDQIRPEPSPVCSPLLAARVNHSGWVGGKAQADGGVQRGGGVVVTDRTDVSVDDEIAAELERLHDEKAILEKRKGSPYCNIADDETRLQKLRQDIKTLQRRLLSIEDDHISHATLASQRMVSIASDDLKRSGPKPTRVKVARKRRALGHAKGGSSTKRQRFTKANKLKSATDILANDFFHQNQGNGEAINKEELAAFPATKLTNDLMSFLSEIQGVALMRPGVDQDVVEGHIRVMATLLQQVQHEVEPFRSEGLDETVEGFRWLVRGMNSPLFHHQLVASALMVSIEKDKKNPAPGSGLLFDHMGLGKTVETLALIMLNRPGLKTSRKSRGGTTLVVTPAAVRMQWVHETSKHCPGLIVIPWNDDMEANAPNAWAADVLVISYSRLLVAFNKETRDKKPEKSVLFKGNTKFHRVVLDEIHMIKSTSTATFAACLALQAKHYWGLTGTPTPNRNRELWAYLLFIRHKEISTRQAFSTALKSQTLKQDLKPCMILRKPGQKFLGTELVKLPAARGTYTEVELDTEERIIYKQLSEDIKPHLENKLTGQGGRRSGKGVWAMLNESCMRFRQAVSSPLLLETVVKEGLWPLERLEAMKAKAYDAECEETPFTDYLILWVKEPKQLRFATPRATSQEVVRVLQQVCVRCTKDIPQMKDPQQAACCHIWCKECLLKHIRLEKMDEADKHPACLRCEMILGEKMTPFVPPEPEAVDDASQPAKARGKRKVPRQQGDDFNGIQPQSKNRTKSDVKLTLFQHLDKNPSRPIPLSVKMKEIIDQIVSWLGEASQDKIIVFTQFIDTNRLLGRVLQRSGIEFLYYTGDMNEQERENAKESFADEPEVKVMFVSLQCGGQALNLTCANRIIISDPWWNRSVEEQAFARVHRIGQKKECYSQRFLAQDTIDTRIYELQLAKMAETENSLEEFQADKSLTTETLREILGGAWLEEGVECRRKHDEEEDYGEEDDNAVNDDEELDFEDGSSDADWNG